MEAESTTRTLTEARKTLGDNFDEHKLTHSVGKERITKAGDGAQLIECTPGMHKALDSIPGTASKLGVVPHASKDKGQEVEGHPLLHNESEASLGSIRQTEGKEDRRAEGRKRDKGLKELQVSQINHCRFTNKQRTNLVAVIT